MGKCPGCHAWNSMVEQRTQNKKNERSSFLPSQKQEDVQAITDIKSSEKERLKTDIGEFNRVLGGGIVAGSLVLVGGDPGIGKSTLLLQISQSIAKQNKKVLYVSGEESAQQIKLRADRLNVLSDHLYVLCETDLEYIVEKIEKLNPEYFIIDSIQTVYHPEITSAPGSVSQVRECTSMLMKIAKTKQIATFIVGHVTKEGNIAGPRMLEHMVDSVLYFEGDRHHAYRMLRAVKNRYGSTNEMGIFEMKDLGLREVSNPSELFLSERPKGVAGSIVVASMEGSRPVLVEMQSLVSRTHFPSPKRMGTGIDHHRLSLIIAVLEKRMGMVLQSHDAFVNVAGGIKLEEPAVDLAIAITIASSFRDKPTRHDDVVFGEIGLTGEVRAVSRVEQRVYEAKKLGFKRVILPSHSLSGWKHPADIQIIGVSTVSEALDVTMI
ncbi:DNA repair protein RadA [Longirhabdus pacifica]|uniref:DNA repair protein RadA n=1 Tax=Longirhabdus pacifica TaxID=2305227 RepID=UPI001F0CB3A0